MIILYNLSIRIVSILFHLASLFHSKAKQFVSGRHGILKSIAHSFSGNSSPVAWIHCASLGEFEQGRPVIEAFKKEFPSFKILLTFFSPSGYEVRKNYPHADFVFYLPWDTSHNAARFIEITRPSLAIFVKYEFWHHYTHTLHRKNIPVLSISSIFRQEQIFFKAYGELFRKILHQFTFFFVQNNESVRLLRSIGIMQCQRNGDTRFDRVYQIVKHAEELPIAKAFKAGEKVFVVGSSWQEDLDILIPFMNEGRIKFIIAPHEVSESVVSNLERSLQVRSIRYSAAHQAKDLGDYNVLIIDNVGLLSRLYAYGEFAYIGGAFGKGLHNILEAACYGVPVFFGNRNYHKFQEANDLINRGGAFEVSGYSDLKAKYEMLNLPENFLLACEVTRHYVEENLGATEKIIDYCRNLLKK